MNGADFWTSVGWLIVLVLVVLYIFGILTTRTIMPPPLYTESRPHVALAGIIFPVLAFVIITFFILGPSWIVGVEWSVHVMLCSAIAIGTLLIVKRTYHAFMTTIIQDTRNYYEAREHHPQ